MDTEPRYEKGLILIPTPIAEDLPLEPVALEVLRTAATDPRTLLLVEELKVARTRWLRWGLPRESIASFIEFNEHTAKKENNEVIPALHAGKRAVLMSDGGLPAFCDPGTELVSLCHDQGIPVTSTPFPNSIALALALSGFDHREFHFSGFLPADAGARKEALGAIARNHRCTVILMDTPYRLQALLKDIAVSQLKTRRVFLATSLNTREEKLYRGSISQVMAQLGDRNKLEFILIVSS
jgi:16S rRNA (cytidine1402-2'-O)-methyltransferase